MDLATAWNINTKCDYQTKPKRMRLSLCHKHACGSLLTKIVFLSLYLDKELTTFAWSC